MMIAQIDPRAVQTAWLREFSETTEGDARTTVARLVTETKAGEGDRAKAVVCSEGDNEATGTSGDRCKRFVGPHFLYSPACLVDLTPQEEDQ